MLKTIVDTLKTNKISNYIIPGLESWILICDKDPRWGKLRLFKATRDTDYIVTPHSHRFDFWCYVIEGNVLNTVYIESMDGDLFECQSLVRVEHFNTYSRSTVKRKRYKKSFHQHNKNETYFMRNDEFHSICFAKGTEVLFLEGPSKSAESHILLPVVNDKTINTFKVEDWMFKE